MYTRLHHKHENIPLNDTEQLQTKNKSPCMAAVNNHMDTFKMYNYLLKTIS